MKSVLQDWLMGIGLRHQGVVLSAVRGCDTLPKHHPVKRFTGALRCDTLVSFSPNPSSFFKQVERPEFTDLLAALDLDELPLHYVMHLLHAAEVLAYYHPDRNRADCWQMFYLRVVKKLHLNPETKEQMDVRLNASEDVFAEDQ